MTRPYPALILAALAATALLGCHRPRNGGEGAASATKTAAAATAVPVATIHPVVNVSDSCPSIGTLADSHGGRIVLNAAQVIRLSPACGAADMTNHLRSFGSGMRYLLVADDLRAGVQPGALFRLSLGPPTTGEAAVIGTLSFFGAQRPGAGGMPHSISFDVTKEVEALAVAGWPANGLGVAVSPSARVTPGADASIGAIRLVAQGR